MQKIAFLESLQKSYKKGNKALVTKMKLEKPVRTKTLQSTMGATFWVKCWFYHLVAAVLHLWGCRTFLSLRSSHYFFKKNKVVCLRRIEQLKCFSQLGGHFVIFP